MRNAFPTKSFRLLAAGAWMTPIALGGCGAVPGQTSEKVPVAKAAQAAVFLPGPGRERGLDAAAHNAACEGCHSDIAREWRDSMHRRAHVDPVYQRAFAIEPMAFCQSCHAPEADLSANVPQPLADLGIGCVTCHVDDAGRIVSGPASDFAKTAPHDVARSNSFSTADACAACHQFEFPDRILRGGVELMQSTVDEHARSAFAKTACADCHMPRVEGHKSHRFGVTDQPAMIRKAVKVRVDRSGPSSVKIAIAPQGVGHAFPTGDLFRRLELTAEAVGPEFNIVDRQVRHLTRHFERRASHRGIAMPFLVADDRVGPGLEPSVVELQLSTEASGRPIAWRVAYQRVEHPVSVDGTDAVIADEVVLAEGVVDGVADGEL